MSLDGKKIAFVVAPGGFFDVGKPVAVICQGAWTLVEADVLRGGRRASRQHADLQPQT